MNIEKRKFARDFYRISTNVNFLQEEIETLQSTFNDLKFDIVLSFGVLHHVESTPVAIRHLSNYCKDLLAIDSIVDSEPRKDRRNILHLLNLKDLAYVNSPKDWAIAAFKYETPYYDSSTSSTPIVNVPEERIIAMSLKICKFEVKQIVHPNDFTNQKLFQKPIGVKETLIVAQRIVEDTHQIILVDKTQLHESNFMFNEIPPGLLVNWVKFQKLEHDTHVISETLQINTSNIKTNLVACEKNNPSR